MKLLCVVFCLFIFSATLFSQEFIKDAKVHLKDKSIVQGDFYYYPNIHNAVQVEDSTGKRNNYLISEIDFIEGKNNLVKNIPYKGTDKLFECIVEGEKLSLYKTNTDDNLKLYVLKDNQLYWLESGKKEVETQSKIYIKEIFIYKGILKVLMNDNAELAKKTDKIICTEKEVTELVVAYNEGHIAYLKDKAAEKKDRTPDWKIYSAYSNYSGTRLSSELSYIGEFGQIGAEYFLSEGSRHSFKFGLEYGKIVDENEPDFVKSFTFNISYYVDFYRSPNCNFYMDVKLANLGKYWNNTESKFYLLPQLSPGIGVKFHLLKQLDVFGEFNNLLVIRNLLHDYSVGVSFDL